MALAVTAVAVVAAVDEEDESVDAATTATTERWSASTTSTASTTTTTRVETTTTARPPESTAARAPDVTARVPSASPQSPTAPQAPPYYWSVAPVSAQQLHASWREGCPIGPARLRMVTVAFWGFDGAVHRGRLVVHQDHAEDLASIFGDLYAHRFAIQRMEPVDAFGGSDDASMAANNTSAFNCRAVTGGTSWSQHSYGWAIDINPVQNPYVRGSSVLPESGRAHLDRSTGATGKIRAGDAVVEAFAARGWEWGGYWSSSKDYQHFSVNGR
jgi:hypothetical protein